MTKQVISTSEAPQAVGAYSQAIASGDLVFCSGQIALDPASGRLLGAGVEEQTTRCLENLSAVLEAAGSGLDCVLKVTVYLADIADFPEFDRAYSRFFASDPPARATVGVAGLPKGARVEVECVARTGA